MAKLHEQVVMHKALRKITLDGIADLRAYLNSPKFGEDIMVNKNDILLRLNELDNNLFFEEVKHPK